MFFEQFKRELLVVLGERAVANHVREHDGGELALLGIFRRHEQIKPERARNETANPLTQTEALSTSCDLPPGRRPLWAGGCSLPLMLMSANGRTRRGELLILISVCSALFLFSTNNN
jgi:hypothetical protein